jgi:outer membrane protein
LTACPAGQAQSLQELYEAARAYDATYLAAKAWPSRPSTAWPRPMRWRDPAAALTAAPTAARSDPPKVAATATRGATLSGRYPLFNRANDATIEQARKGAGRRRPTWTPPSRT